MQYTHTSYAQGVIMMDAVVGALRLRFPQKTLIIGLLIKCSTAAANVHICVIL